MKIKYLGQCGFLITSQNTRAVTDPYLSYGVDENHYSEKTPWKRLYPPPCTLSELSPDIIVISHAHDDHLDPITVRKYLESGGDAFFIAPAPICGILSELGVKNERLIRAYAENEIIFNDLAVLPIPCAHTELHTDKNGDYLELSYFIKSGGKTVFFGGDMSLYDGICERISKEDPDLLLLPCNGRDEERTANGIIGNITEVEAAELAARLKAPFLPMHHDLYEINGCPEENIAAAARAFGATLITKKEFTI